MNSEVAERYAQGLFELARETDTVAAKKDSAETLLSVLESNPELIGFLKAVKITRDEKKAMIDRLFASVMDADVVRFIKLIIDKGRVNYLKEMLQVFTGLADDAMGIVRATVESARRLDEKDMNRIREALMKKTGRTVILKNKITPELIAGIKVTMGNNVTDVSMKNKIDSLKGALLKGGQQA